MLRAGYPTIFAFAVHYENSVYLHEEPNYRFEDQLREAYDASYLNLTSVACPEKLAKVEGLLRNFEVFSKAFVYFEARAKAFYTEDSTPIAKPDLPEVLQRFIEAVINQLP